MTEHSVEKLSSQPVVWDTDYVPATDDPASGDAQAKGVVVVIDTQDGEPNDEEVVTFVAGTPNKFKTRPASGGFVPTYIAPGQTFTVPENTQALYALPIVVDGAITTSGDLVMVN